MWAGIRQAVRVLAGGVVAGAAVGILHTVVEAGRSHWIGLGLHRLAITSLKSRSLRWILIGAGVAAAVWLCDRTLAKLVRDGGQADRVFRGLLAGITSLGIFAFWAFQVNSTTFRAAWREFETGPWSLTLPRADWSPLVVAANLGILLIALAVGAGLYHVVRKRQDRRGSTKGPRNGVDWVVPAAALAVAGTVLWPSIIASRSVADGRPNIILISIDTLRADHLGAYGYPRDTSPNIDALARQGVVFENAVAQANWTLPSHMSLLTSQVPAVHGVRTVRQRLDPAKVTLAEILKNAGYTTVGITGGYNVDARFGFAQGFDEYTGDKFYHLMLEEKVKYGQGVRLSYLLPDVIDLLSRPAARPFFLFLHFWDTHAPYMPHEGYIERFPSRAEEPEVFTHQMVLELRRHPEKAGPEMRERIAALYDNEIRYADHYLGVVFRTLRERGLREDTIVVLTSDHGDEMLEHGLIGHGVGLYEPEVHVPLIVTYPRKLAGNKRIASVARSIDIPVTILELAGVEPPEKVARQLQGADLFAPTRETNGPLPALSEGRGASGCQIALRMARYKLIRDSCGGKGISEELYDLESDRAERVNLLEQRPDVALQLRQALASLTRQHGELAGAHPPERIELDEEFRKRLRSLGYVQ